jgi:hypothetical protein
VLPGAAELAEISSDLLTPQKLPELWTRDEIKVQSVLDYFSGGRIVQVDRGSYKEPMLVPKVGPLVVEKAIVAAVENSSIWLLSGPASILSEAVPAGVLTPDASLRSPPTPIAAAEILPENLPAAWKDDETTGLAVATALTHKVGKVLPWKTIRDVISGSLQARFTELVDGSAKWPCEIHEAQLIRLKVATSGSWPSMVAEGGESSRSVLVASAFLEPLEVQELGDKMDELLTIKAKSKVPIKFHVRVEVGDGNNAPPKEVAEEVTRVLADVSDRLQLR